MKRASLFLAATALACIASGSPKDDATPAAAVPLFDGKSLAGWSHVLVEPVPIENVWSVVDGVIICKGAPMGYLRTVDSYENFTLTFEWRWAPGGEPGNSGVLLRIAGEPETFMPKCVEAQLKHGSAGDLWAFYGAAIDGDAARLREVKANPNLGDFKGYAKTADAEKPPGEWNQYEITVKGDTITLKVNGKLVNEARGLDVVSGPIGFQSEGGEIHFRNLQIQPL